MYAKTDIENFIQNCNMQFPSYKVGLSNIYNNLFWSTAFLFILKMYFRGYLSSKILFEEKTRRFYGRIFHFTATR